MSRSVTNVDVFLQAPSQILDLITIEMVFEAVSFPAGATRSVPGAIGDSGRQRLFSATGDAPEEVSFLSHLGLGAARLNKPRSQAILSARNTAVTSFRTSETAA
jgi:hypothetical protein